jgi:SnoaL-like domain
MATDPAINDLVHLYCDAVARKDKEQWAATWAKDARWELGHERITEGREAIVNLWVMALDRYAVVLQLAHSGTAETDDATGTGAGRWYFTENTQSMKGDRGVMVGYYDDTYSRSEGKWVFASRVLTVLYRGPADLSGTFTIPPPLT